MTFPTKQRTPLAVGALCVACALAAWPVAAPAATHAAAAPKNRPAAGATRVAADSVTYGIVRDETLSTIASRFTGDSRNWRVIGKINHIANDRAIPVGTSIVIPARLLREREAFATVAAVHGEVSILGKDGTIIPANVGAALPEGAMIATSAGGFITLALKDGTRFAMTPASNLQLTLLRMKEFTERPQTSLMLEKGRITSTVTPFSKPETRYEVHTPLTSAGVRGTQFRVRIDGGKSYHEVLHGTVRVAPPGDGAAAAGRAGTVRDLPANVGAVVAAAGQAVAPVTLPAPPAIDVGSERQDKLPLRFALTLAPEQRPDVHGFRASVSRDAEGQDTVASVTAAAVATAAGADVVRIADLDDGHYYVHIASVDGNGLEGRPATRAFTLKARPLPPFPNAPGPKIRDSVDGKPVAVLFKWADTGAGNVYHLQIAADAAFGRILFDRSDLKNTEWLQDAVPAGRVYWRVATVETSGAAPDQGPYSDVKALEILPAQAAPEPSQDEDTMHFSWRGEPGQRFVFETAADAGFAHVLLHVETDVAQAAFARPAAGTYFARVRSIDADGYEGVFSQPQKFEVIGVWKTGYGGVWRSGDGPLRSQY